MSKSEMVMDAKDIERTIVRMTHRILEVHKGAADLTLIGIQTRGVYLAKRIQAIVLQIEGVEVPIGVLDITMYRDDWTRISHQPIVKPTEIPFSVDGKQIILIDDVLFTGRTVRAAMDELIDFGRPDLIELAVLIDRGHREFPIQADYVGKYIETERSEMVNVLLSEYDGIDQIVIE